jgi:hypothetical protein
MTVGELVDTHGFENADRVTNNPSELLVWLRDFLPKLG